MENNLINLTLSGKTFADVHAKAVALSKELEKFKATTGGKTAKPAKVVEEDETTFGSDEIEDDTSFDTPEEMLGDDAGEDETQTKPAKTTKVKLTDKEVNAAAMAHARQNGRPATLKILEKKFKVKSILELKPEQYAAVVKALEV